MIEIFISPFFPNEKLGGDYKETRTHRLFLRGREAFHGEIKSAVIKFFNPIEKSYTSIRVVNKPDEVWKLASYIFDFLASDVKEVQLLAQCNHTFVFRLGIDNYVHVGFSTDDILEEREFSLLQL